MKRTCEYNRSNKNSDKGELLKYSEFILHNRIEKKKVLLSASFLVSFIRRFVNIFETFVYVLDRFWPFDIRDHTWSFDIQSKVFGVWFPRFHWLNRSDDYDPTDVASLIRLRLSRACSTPRSSSHLLRSCPCRCQFCPLRQKHLSSEAPLGGTLQWCLWIQI